MTILSDITLREMCDRPILSRDEIHQQLSNDAEYTDSILAIARARSSNNAQLMAILELKREASARFLAQDFMIYPFTPTQVREVEHRATRGGELCVEPRRIISRGTTSYGYDVSLADELKLFTNLNASIIDPKRLNDDCLVDAEVKFDADTGERYVLLPPNSYILGHTVEYFKIPRDVLVICLGKSTYARAGAIVNVTPIEPGFMGNVVIEISNSTNLPLKVYVEEGIAQFLFFRGDRPCEVSYGDRGGKYQGQTGVTLPKV